MSPIPSSARSFCRSPTTPSKKRHGGWKYDRCLWPDPSKKFGQHFLLTKNARNVDPAAIWSLTDFAAIAA